MDDSRKPSPEEKKRKKRNLIIVLVMFTLLGAISFILTEAPQLFEKKDDSPKSMYSDRLHSYTFYPTDLNLDVTADAEYMEKDRQIYYKKGPVSVAVRPEELADYNDAVLFFVEYFATVIDGDTETYNRFFSENYYRTGKPYVEFAPQMLYDILIEELMEEKRQDGGNRWTFRVEYKIHRNDGTFRNDMESDAVRPLFYVLEGDPTGDVKIDAISRNLTIQ